MQSTRPQYFRFRYIDREIRRGRYPNCPQLGETLGVSTRTIQRDVEFMKDSLDAPVEFDPIRNGYHYTEGSFNLPFEQMTEGELLAMLVADKALGEFRGTAFEGVLRGIFVKLAEALPLEVTISPQALAEAYTFVDTAPVRSDPGIFRALQEAVNEGCTIEILYHTQSRNRTGRRLIDPYHLASVDGEWFLLAWCHERREVRVFRPSRIRELRATEERFHRPDDFNAARFLSAKFHAMSGDRPVSIRIRFDASLAGYIQERDWMLEHEIQFRTDGGLDLTVRVENADAIIRWVLQWGFGAEIISPPWVRRRLREQLERIRERYEPHPSSSVRSRRKGQGTGRVLKPPSPAKMPA
jgi:proteasome accessory factor B